jgi:hypothetical protein
MPSQERVGLDPAHDRNSDPVPAVYLPKYRPRRSGPCSCRMPVAVQLQRRGHDPGTTLRGGICGRVRRGVGSLPTKLRDRHQYRGVARTGTLLVYNGLVTRRPRVATELIMTTGP